MSYDPMIPSPSLSQALILRQWFSSSSLLFVMCMETATLADEVPSTEPHRILDIVLRVCCVQDPVPVGIRWGPLCICNSFQYHSSWSLSSRWNSYISPFQNVPSYQLRSYDSRLSISQPFLIVHFWIRACAREQDEPIATTGREITDTR